MAVFLSTETSLYDRTAAQVNNNKNSTSHNIGFEVRATGVTLVSGPKTAEQAALWANRPDRHPPAPARPEVGSEKKIDTGAK